MTESVPAVTLKRRVVFVVDDEELIARTLALILNNAGFDAHAFYSGQEAIDSLEKLQPDLLVTDVVMKGMNGIEAAIITRTRLPTCKILLFSGQASTADRLETARKQGYEFDILAKPIHPTALIEKLTGIL
jgi:CheY-like chemotaxis protein